MPKGLGKYDDLCTYVRERSDAYGAAILIVGGKNGDGFSVQFSDSLLHALPDMLEFMARKIRSDLGSPH